MKTRSEILAVTGVLVILLVVAYLRSMHNRSGLHLIEDSHGNEALLLDALISWSPHGLF